MFTTARRCCGVFVIRPPDTKLQTHLLTYLAERWILKVRMIKWLAKIVWKTATEHLLWCASLQQQFPHDCLAAARHDTQRTEMYTLISPLIIQLFTYEYPEVKRQYYNNTNWTLQHYTVYNSRWSHKSSSIRPKCDNACSTSAILFTLRWTKLQWQ